MVRTTTILFVICLFGCMTLESSAFCQTTPTEQSEVIFQSITRTTYLEKVKNIEQQIAAFETKIAWVKSDANEDSIAKAQGWYEMMNNNLKKFNDQIASTKIEQIQNYYTDILGFPLDADQIQNSIMPEMILNRTELAGDYPQFEEFVPASESSIIALKGWAIEFPQQYQDFTSYLEKLVIGHLQ